MCEVILEAEIHRRQFCCVAASPKFINHKRHEGTRRLQPTEDFLRGPLCPWWLKHSSALQQIHGLEDVMHPEIFCQCRLFGRNGVGHGLGDVAIRRMSGGSSTQLGNVDGLGKIHLKQSALAESEWDRIL